jgi:hypothetical protein
LGRIKLFGHVLLELSRGSDSSKKHTPKGFTWCRNCHILFFFNFCHRKDTHQVSQEKMTISVLKNRMPLLPLGEMPITTLFLLRSPTTTPKQKK